MTKDRKQSLVFFTKFTFLNCLQIYFENLLIFNNLLICPLLVFICHVILFKIKIAKISCNIII